MLDLAWTEMVVVALVAIIVIGPKELPRMLRTIGQGVRKLQSMARDFRTSLDDMAREADIAEIEREVEGQFAEPLSNIGDELGSDFTLGEDDTKEHKDDGELGEEEDGASTEAGEDAPRPEVGAAGDEDATEEVAERPAGETGAVGG